MQAGWATKPADAPCAERDDHTLYIHKYIPRALSLRNLVLGHEIGKVLPVAVGLDLPSKVATNWMSSLFSRSVERRGGGLVG